MDPASHHCFFGVVRPQQYLLPLQFERALHSSLPSWDKLRYHLAHKDQLDQLGSTFQ